MRSRPRHTLSKEHQERLAASNKLRASNPNKMGPDAPDEAALKKEAKRVYKGRQRRVPIAEKEVVDASQS